MALKKYKARIKRNKLVELAGSYFRDENSDIVKLLNKEDDKAYVGIQREDGIYTIIGDQFTYYLTESQVAGKISHVDLTEILAENALTLGKKGNFEFVKVSGDELIWFSNAEIMNALWSTILIFNNKDGKTIM